MIFISKKHSALNLVLDPKTFQVTNGRTIMTGLNGDFPVGMSVQFANKIYETNDPKIIKALKNHPRYGVTFFSEELAKEKETGEVEINAQAVAEVEEKNALVEDIASQCEWCGFKAATKSGLQLHQKACPKKPK